jgi:hypothetical protein
MSKNFSQFQDCQVAQIKGGTQGGSINKQRGTQGGSINKQKRIQGGSSPQKNKLIC